jgi:hypothetical protein
MQGLVMHPQTPLETQMWVPSHNETMEKGESQNMIPSSQHFEDKRMWRSSRMGLRRTHKQKFKMTSTYTTKERGQLMQVECK